MIYHLRSHLCDDRFFEGHLLLFPGVDGQDFVVFFLLEGDRLDIVEDSQQMSLDGVRVAGLTQDLQQCRIGDEEEARKAKTLLFQVSGRQEQAGIDSVRTTDT